MCIDSCLSTIICGDCLEVLRGFLDGCVGWLVYHFVVF